MSIRPHPTKDGWWIIDVGRGASRQRLPFEGTIEEARLWEMDLRAMGTPEQILISPKFSQLVPLFIVAYRNDHQPKGTSRTLISLEHLALFFGNLTLPSITDSLIEQYKTKRLTDGVKPTTINKELCALSSLFKWARQKKYIVHPPSIRKFPGKLVKAPLPVIPMQADAERIISAVLKTWKQTAFRLMLFCGLRREEALNLKCQDIMLDRNLMIVRGKGNKQRIVPILREDVKNGLQESIEKVHGRGYLWINPRTERPYIDIMDSLKEAATRLGFKGRVYNHLLRHCFGTYGHEAGLSLRDLQELLGHSTSQVTEIYTHLSSAHLIEAMSRWQTPVTQRVNSDTSEPAPEGAV